MIRRRGPFVYKSPVYEKSVKIVGGDGHLRLFGKPVERYVLSEKDVAVLPLRIVSDAGLTLAMKHVQRGKPAERAVSDPFHTFTVSPPLLYAARMSLTDPAPASPLIGNGSPLSSLP